LTSATRPDGVPYFATGILAWSDEHLPDHHASRQ
jgi:hypothetical protein